MSFKPGDKALVTSGCFDVNIGQVVEILRPQEPNDDIYLHAEDDVKIWRVRSTEFMYYGLVDNSRFWVVTEGPVPECSLTKLTGQ